MNPIKIAINAGAKARTSLVSNLTKNTPATAGNAKTPAKLKVFSNTYEKSVNAPPVLKKSTALSTKAPVQKSAAPVAPQAPVLPKEAGVARNLITPKWLLNGLGEFFAKVGIALLGVMSETGRAVLDTTFSFGKTVLEGITGTGKAALGGIAGTGKAAFDGALGTVSAVLRGGGIGEIAKAASDGIKGTFKAASDGIVETAKAMRSAVRELGLNALSGAIISLGTGVSAVQSALGLAPKARPLTPTERQYLEAVYGDSINFDKVQIKEGDSGLLNSINPGLAFAMGNTIYISSDYISTHTPQQVQQTLVHEMMHVWQNQNGGSDYLVKAIANYVIGEADPSSGKGRGYYYQREVVQGTPFEKLAPDQQAQLIQDAYAKKVIPPQTPPRKFEINIAGTTYDCTQYALDAWDMVQKGQGAP